MNPWDSKTPERPVNLPRRARNHGAAMFFKEVREAALKLRKSDPNPPTQEDLLLMSAKEKIPLRPESSPSRSKMSDNSSKLPEKYTPGAEKGDEIPEELHIEPFNKLSKCFVFEVSRSSFGQTPTTAAAEQPFIRLSNLPYNFKRHFSRQVSDRKGENTTEGEKATSGRAVPIPVQEACFAQQHSKGRTCVSGSAFPIKSSSKPVSGVECSPNKALLAKLSNSPPPVTPVKDVHSYKGLDPSSKGAAATVGSPTPPDCTPAKLMSATPSLRETKRCYMSPEGDDAIQSINKLVRRASRCRSLKFDTPKKGANIQDDVQECECSSSIRNDILDTLPKILIRSVIEKLRELSKEPLEEDPAISQAKSRQQMIAGLPKLFDMIYFFIRSSGRNVMTKEELMHKLVSFDLNVVYRREVEEKLSLLLELVPELIYEKLTLSGGVLICIGEICCPELIHARLAEAK